MRHRLDHANGSSSMTIAVLEGARLGLVGVADQVVRPDRLRGRPPPTCARSGRRRRRGRAASTRSPRGSRPAGPSVERAPQRLVAAVGAVVVEALGIDRRRRGAAAAAPASPCWATGSRCHPPGQPARERVGDLRGACGRDRALDGILSRLRHEQRPAPARTGRGTGSRARSRGRCRVLAGRADGALELGHELVGARGLAGDVVADVRHHRRARLEREQRVEARDAVGLGGRDRQPRGRCSRARPG